LGRSLREDHSFDGSQPAPPSFFSSEVICVCWWRTHTQPATIVILSRIDVMVWLLLLCLLFACLLATTQLTLSHSHPHTRLPPPSPSFSSSYTYIHTHTPHRTVNHAKRSRTKRRSLHPPQVVSTLCMCTYMCVCV
jgi:hypothetical protein